VRAGLDGAASGDPEQARAQLEAGLALYGGDFLADEPYAEWPTAERDRLRQLAARGLRALADVHEQAGELDAAVDTLDRLVGMDPYDLDVHRTLLRLVLRQGRRTDAVRRYTALRRRMLGMWEEDLDFTLADLHG
jgi:DNA-binding SARP family transcriptional activator